MEGTDERKRGRLAVMGVAVAQSTRTHLEGSLLIGEASVIEAQPRLSVSLQITSL